jgi:glycosyltransferase involved in cell wall biosynthesis
MAAGRPVVATDVGDVRAMLSIENRPFIVGRLDTAAFVEKLRLLLSNSALRDAIGRVNRGHALQYSDLRMAEAYRALIVEGSERQRADAHQPIRSGAGHD